MIGPELSVLAVCDGTAAGAAAPAQDFKRVDDGDQGPNTGGMGAYSPVPDGGDDLVGRVMDEFIEPTLQHCASDGIDYRGTLYAGLMLTPDGPKLLEYNVRFGDPEAQVVLPRLSSDLVDLLASAADGELVDADADVRGRRGRVRGRGAAGLSRSAAHGRAHRRHRRGRRRGRRRGLLRRRRTRRRRQARHRRRPRARRRRLRPHHRSGARRALRRRAAHLVSRACSYRNDIAAAAAKEEH